jgi:hypothetical protein
VGIKRVDKTKQASTYECLTLPLTINLLHPAKKDANTYQNEGTIVAALETYETVVTIL